MKIVMASILGLGLGLGLMIPPLAHAADAAPSPVAIVSVGISCTNESDAKILGSVIFVNDKFAALHMDDTEAMMVYDEDEQVLSLVNPMEFDMEKHDLIDYPIVVTLTESDAAKMRAKVAFSMTVTIKDAKQGAIENCTVQP